MGLQAKLDNMKKEFEATAPPEALQVMHSATDELRRSGIMSRVLKVGGRVPAFALPDQQGQLVEPAALLESGPLVISFYRGVW